MAFVSLTLERDFPDSRCLFHGTPFCFFFNKKTSQRSKHEDAMTILPLVILSNRWISL